MLSDRALKIGMVEFAMLFLVFTLNGIISQEESKSAISIHSLAQTITPAVGYEYQDGTADEPAEEPEVTMATQRSFSQEEKELLLQIAVAEAESESTEEKALVMLVVLNRMEDEGFPDDMREVIFEERQFTVTEENGRWYTTVPNEDCNAALELVQSGWDESNGALYFESEEKDGWHSENLEYLFTVGGHRFYK